MRQRRVKAKDDDSGIDEEDAIDHNDVVLSSDDDMNDV